MCKGKQAGLVYRKIKGICLYVRTNERVHVCEYMGVLLCCDGVCGYTHTHISFDVGVIWVGVVL